MNLESVEDFITGSFR
ncbi:hypothetical protein CICLE_v100140272mg, partial [Citrus x clementina]